MADKFAAMTGGLTGPATNGTALNLGGTADIDLSSQPSRSIYVGGTGVVKVDMLGGGTGVGFTVPVTPYELRVRASKVYCTANGTTATNLVALW